VRHQLTYSILRFFDSAGNGPSCESSAVFDAAALRHIVQELAQQAAPLERGTQAEALRDLTAVGTFLRDHPKTVVFGRAQLDKGGVNSCNDGVFSRTSPPAISAFRGLR
jgi:hypothetical protein